MDDKRNERMKKLMELQEKCNEELREMERKEMERIELERKMIQNSKVCMECETDNLEDEDVIHINPFLLSQLGKDCAKLLNDGKIDEARTLYHDFNRKYQNTKLDNSTKLYMIGVQFVLDNYDKIKNENEDYYDIVFANKVYKCKESFRSIFHSYPNINKKNELFYLGIYSVCNTLHLNI